MEKEIDSEQNMNDGCMEKDKISSNENKVMEKPPSQTQINDQEQKFDQISSSNKSLQEDEGSDKKSKRRKLIYLAIFVFLLIVLGIVLGIVFWPKQHKENYILQFENKDIIRFQRNDSDGVQWTDNYDNLNQTYQGLSSNPPNSNFSYQNYTYIYLDGKSKITYLFFGVKGLDDQTFCVKNYNSDMNQLETLKQLQQLQKNESTLQKDVKKEDSKEILKETYDFGESQIELTKVNNKLSEFQLKSSTYKETYQVDNESKNTIDISDLNIDFSVCVDSKELGSNIQNENSIPGQNQQNSDNQNGGEHLRNLQQTEGSEKFRNLGLIEKTCGNWCGSINSGISSQSDDQTCASKCNTLEPTQECLNCRPYVDNVDYQCVLHDFCIYRNTQGYYKAGGASLCKGTHACYCDRLLSQSVRLAQFDSAPGDCANHLKVQLLESTFYVSPCCCNFKLSFTFVCGVSWYRWRPKLKYCTISTEWSNYSLGYPLCSTLSSYMN